MTDYIVKAEEESMFYMFKDYQPLVRCKDCEYRRHRVGMCDIWHYRVPMSGFCHRGQAVKKDE